MFEPFFTKQFKIDRNHPIRVFRQRALRAQGFAVASHALETNASLFGLTTLLATTVIVLILLFSRGQIPSIRGITGEDVLRHLTTSLNQTAPRQIELTRTNAEQERKLKSQVHFIAELIMAHRSKSAVMTNKDAYRYSNMIVSESVRSGFDPLFIASVMKSESTFNPHARSHAGAIGLMQMMPQTITFISNRNLGLTNGVSNLHDPIQNIRYGVLYLEYLRQIFDGDKEKMLIAYNWGPENMRQALRSARTIPSSTIHYAKKVITRYNDWAGQFRAQASRYKHFDFERAAVDSAYSSSALG